ncbi:thioredoxin family protein [Candidatus Peregrinibacteria bacterium]|nr:thioredoxin family protein [Candidatus Peregrinibacteria bacterium]
MVRSSSPQAATFRVFSADCPLCRATLTTLCSAIQKRGCGCQVKEHRCSGDECCEPAKEYNVKSVPTIIRDGKIVHVGKLTEQEAEELLPVS